MFIRKDRIKKQLESPYDDPFQVVDKKEKYFIIKIKDKDVTMSIDRLKPAYFLQIPDKEANQQDYLWNLQHTSKS